MIRNATAFAAALGAMAIPTTAMADDPRDPTMQTPEVIERDREIIRQLNLEQLAYVRKRDAAYAEGWRAYSRAKTDPRYSQENYQREMQKYQRDQDRYQAQRKQYEQAMADWRRNAAACRAGQTSACN